MWKIVINSNLNSLLKLFFYSPTLTNNNILGLSSKKEKLKKKKKRTKIWNKKKYIIKLLFWIIKHIAQYNIVGL